MTDYEREVVLSPKGSLRRTVKLKDVRIPDLWHITESLKETGRVAEANDILSVWHLAHSLKMNLAGDV